MPDEKNGFVRFWESSWEPLLPIHPGSARCTTCGKYLKYGQRWQERPVCSLKLYHVDAADCPPITAKEEESSVQAEVQA